MVGGGNTAVEEALYLTNHATARHRSIHRRDQLRAEKILQARLFANPKIAVVWDSVVDEIVGGGEPPRVTGVSIDNVKTGAHERARLRRRLHRHRPHAGDRALPRPAHARRRAATS